MMNITIRRYFPPGNNDGYFYQVRVVKCFAQQNTYVVNIKNLSVELQGVFADSYHRSLVKRYFYQVDFFPLNKLHDGYNRFGKDRLMQYTLAELREFLKAGIGATVLDFVTHTPSHAIVAIPTRQGLGRLYHEIMRDFAQVMGYQYNDSYRELAIYVVEI